MKSSDTAWICETCAVQFPRAPEPPGACPVCEDERQYVGLDGQRWTTMEELAREHRNVIRELEADRLYGIGTSPSFGIGQRALLIRRDEGNVLWDCLTLLDAETVRRVEELGGIDWIAISHPHYYGALVEWSRAFGDVPVLLHEAERQWVMRPDPCIEFWRGDTRELAPGLTLVRTSGHFEGYQTLHWADGAGGRGALLSGDQPTVCWDRRRLGFMYSYPNFIPLGPEEVLHTVRVLEPFRFDRVYGAWWGRVLESGGKESLRASAADHLRRIGAGAEAERLKTG